MLPALVLFAACTRGSPAEERTAWLAALGLEDPAAAFEACMALHDDALRADCGLAAAERLAHTRGPTTGDLLARCRRLDGWAADECAFQVGERRRDPAACAAAGRFADDCRLHLFSTGLASWVPAGASPSDPALLERLRSEGAATGLDPTDERAASAYFRWVLGGRVPLDRGACDALSDPALQDACRHTGLALYADRLNHARDTRTYPCGGGVLPASLAYAPDPEIDRLRQRREEEDLCP
ncbi:MAG: hypothetical protein JXB39_12560 [Deltaproteobacteria bacterium]|nr:hypothetical protein [Deltaproteobacteria bacterium]